MSPLQIPFFPQPLVEKDRLPKDLEDLPVEHRSGHKKEGLAHFRQIYFLQNKKRLLKAG